MKQNDEFYQKNVLQIKLIRLENIFLSQEKNNSTVNDCTANKRAKKKIKNNHKLSVSSLYFDVHIIKSRTLKLNKHSFCYIFM